MEKCRKENLGWHLNATEMNKNIIRRLFRRQNTRQAESVKRTSGSMTDGTAAIPINEAVPLHWKRITNWGDTFAPLVVEYLSEKPVFYTDLSLPHYATLGSFLNARMGRNTTVWGTGIIQNDVTPNPEAKYCAVRGPLTRRNVMAQGGHCPEIYGDPGYFVSHVFPLRDVEKKYEFGIIPHWRDIDLFKSCPHYSQTKIINVATFDLYRFCKEINQCHVIITGSLHALITAHAYNIPAVWIKSNNALGDDTKFYDYYHANNVDISPVIADVPTVDFNKLLSSAVTVTHDIRPFARACPFISGNKLELLAY